LSIKLYRRISDMENLINKILKILKEHVRQNNKEIQYNQEEINFLLSENSPSLNQKELDGKKDLNKDLLNENKDFIRMQFEITEFMEKYGHLFIENEGSEIEVDDLHGNEKLNFFYQTISGKLKFDHMHPMYNNSEFFKELLDYYKEREDYEKCQELLLIKELREK
jgi:hypothetical protein